MDYLIFYLLIINFIALVVFGSDKLFARKGLRRVPEKTLFLLALAGGCLGCLFAMRLFRHKTLHKKFSIGLPVICLVWAGALVWFGFIK
jgi:uncharacterized membrane protein YsdA (DUF1294 family)